MDELNPTFTFTISEQLGPSRRGRHVHRDGDSWCLRYTGSHEDETTITLEELEKNIVLARREARESRDRLKTLEALQYRFVVSQRCPSCGVSREPGDPVHGGFRCDCWQR